MQIIKSNHVPGIGACYIETDGAYYYVHVGSRPPMRFTSLEDAMREYSRYSI